MIQKSLRSGPKRSEIPHWRNRIVGHGERTPAEFTANPYNWRLHPRDQQVALSGMLDTVGWVQQVIVNRRTNTLVDGHLRVALALQRSEPSVPVLYIDVSEEEERLILASLDPLSAMARAEEARLAELMKGLEAKEEAVQGMLSKLAADVGILPPGVEFKEYDEGVAAEVEYVECPSCGYRWPR
jgi:hypothetical protein